MAISRAIVPTPTAENLRRFISGNTSAGPILLFPSRRLTRCERVSSDMPIVRRVAFECHENDPLKHTPKQFFLESLMTKAETPSS